MFLGGRSFAIYKEWTRQARAVQLVSDFPKGRLAVLPRVPPCGAAKLICRTLELGELATDRGLGKLRERVGVSYLCQARAQYDFAQSRHDRFRRAHGQNMHEYLTEMSLVKRERLQVDCDLTISDMAFAQKMQMSTVKVMQVSALPRLSEAWRPSRRPCC